MTSAQLSISPCGPRGPCGPVSPSVPAGPWIPWIPWIPWRPCGPWSPWSPWTPWGPCGPTGPTGPSQPRTIASRTSERFTGYLLGHELELNRALLSGILRRDAARPEQRGWGAGGGHGHPARAGRLTHPRRAPPAPSNRRQGDMDPVPLHMGAGGRPAPRGGEISRMPSTRPGSSHHRSRHRPGPLHTGLRRTENRQRRRHATATARAAEDRDIERQPASKLTTWTVPFMRDVELCFSRFPNQTAAFPCGNPWPPRKPPGDRQRCGPPEELHAPLHSRALNLSWRGRASTSSGRGPCRSDRIALRPVHRPKPTLPPSIARPSPPVSTCSTPSSRDPSIAAKAQGRSERTTVPSRRWPPSSRRLNASPGRAGTLPSPSLAEDRVPDLVARARHPRPFADHGALRVRVALQVVLEVPEEEAPAVRHHVGAVVPAGIGREARVDQADACRPVAVLEEVVECHGGALVRGFLRQLVGQPEVHVGLPDGDPADPFGVATPRYREVTTLTRLRRSDGGEPVRYGAAVGDGPPDGVGGRVDLDGYLDAAGLGLGGRHVEIASPAEGGWTAGECARRPDSPVPILRS